MILGGCPQREGCPVTPSSSPPATPTIVVSIVSTSTRKTTGRNPCTATLQNGAGAALLQSAYVSGSWTSTSGGFSATAFSGYFTASSGQITFTSPAVLKQVTRMAISSVTLLCYTWNSAASTSAIGFNF